MAVDRLNISFEPELGDAVRSSARRSGIDVSQWLAAAAAAQLRAEALAEFRDQWDLSLPSSTAATTALARADVELAFRLSDVARSGSPTTDVPDHLGAD